MVVKVLAKGQGNTCFCVMNKSVKKQFKVVFDWEDGKQYSVLSDIVFIVKK